MSPGATFERVYHELKRMLAEGELPPGTPIEPALIGKQIASSITPIRDALHRLTGERLVEAPNHNGFRVPLLTEAALRDLYNWNSQILRLASRSIGADASKISGRQTVSSEGIVAKITNTFSEIARESGNGEHFSAIQQINDRLSPYRRFESVVLPDGDEELALLIYQYRHGNKNRLGILLAQYHRRRSRAASLIVKATLVSIRPDG